MQQVLPHCGPAGIDYYLLRGTQLNGLSQANIYGDDCTPATNYPLARLRSVSTAEVYYEEAEQQATATRRPARRPRKP